MVAESCSGRTDTAAMVPEGCSGAMVAEDCSGGTDAGATVAEGCSGEIDASVVGSIVISVADGCETWVVCRGLTGSDAKDGSGAGPTDETGAGSEDDSGTTLIV